MKFRHLTMLITIFGLILVGVTLLIPGQQPLLTAIGSGCFGAGLVHTIRYWKI